MSANVELGSAKPSATSTVVICVAIIIAKSTDRTAPATTASFDQSFPANHRRCMSPCIPTRKAKSKTKFIPSKPVAIDIAPAFWAWYVRTTESGSR